MTFNSLGEFIDAAARIGEVQTVEGANLDNDVGCLAEMVGERKGPMLVFDKFEGHHPGYRVCANALRTPRRLALALDLPIEAHRVELARLWKERKKTLAAIPPKVLSDGSVLECVQRGEDVDLTKFPAPRWHSKDGGRYIGTGDLVVLRDPEQGWVNVGVYRGMVQGKNRLSLWIGPQKHGRIIAERYWARGQNAPVAVVLGCDPLTWMQGSMAAPFGVPEYSMAGAYRGEPLDVVHLPDTGLPVPAHAELVIEGEIPPIGEESAYEGPFGEWPGYYSHQGYETVVRIKTIYHRRNPIILGVPPVRPIGDNNYIGVPTTAVQVWEHLERSNITDITGVWAFSNQLLLVASLKQRYAGHAQLALNSMTGFRQGDMKTFFVTVDDDIDPSNLDEVVWAMSTRTDPATAVNIIRGTWTGGLDPRVSPEQRKSGDLTMGRMTINACKPFVWRDQFPATATFSAEDRQAVTKRWPDILCKVRTGLS
jgi:UbiD family decarboxylase